MALLDILQNQGSLLSSTDGKNPQPYDGASNYRQDLTLSQLDLDGRNPKKYDPTTSDLQSKVGSSLYDLPFKNPQPYDGASNFKQDLEKSQLDLDGKTPSKYLDNLPK